MSLIAGVNRNYYKKFKFVVEVEGVIFAGFRTCSDLRMQMAKIEHSECGSLIPNKSVGRLTFPDITLARGATQELDLYAWALQSALAVGSPAPVQGVVPNLFKRTIDVVQQNRLGVEMRRWRLHNAFVIDFKAGDWDNEADENTIEEIMLAYDFFTIGGDGGAATGTTAAVFGLF